jgi:hypothetical protein
MALETGTNSIKIQTIDNDTGKVHLDVTYPELDYQDVVFIQETIALALIQAGKNAILQSQLPNSTK